MRQKSARSKGITITMTSNRVMFDDYGFPVFEDNSFPLAYLITFRIFGTWLHGDERLSVKRDGWNIYGTPRLESNERLEQWMAEEMKQAPFILTEKMREVVDRAIRSVSDRRGYLIKALNVRSNHAHVVVSHASKPERIADSLKAEATKMLREFGLVEQNMQIWSRGRSRRYFMETKTCGCGNRIYVVRTGRLCVA